MSIEGIGCGDGPGYYDVKLGDEAAADTSNNRCEVGKNDECIIESTLLNCDIASLTRYSTRHSRPKSKPDPAFSYSPLMRQQLKRPCTTIQVDVSITDGQNKD
jgi:hypothetical protein